MTSDTLDFDAIWELGEKLQAVGGLQRMSGHEIVAEQTIQALGETFTVGQLQAYCATVNAQRTQRDAEMVRCDCGCTVQANQVMSASLGTSCPDCYDRMSGC